MTDAHERERYVSRRDALKVCLAPAGIAAARWLVGCTDTKEGAEAERDQDQGESETASDQRDAGMMRDGRAQLADAKIGADAADDARIESSGPDLDASAPPTEASADARASNAEDASSDATAAQGLDARSSGDVPWATGGTESMQGGYPDPFTMGAAGMVCRLYPAQTIGPCYAETTEREDISDGITGLPLRLSFLVVSADGCTPVANAEVDVWSAGSDGIYSAYPAGDICTGILFGPSTEGETYCRGKRSTDESGRVDFSTVFPGWYSGRAIHIHFTVRVGGQEYITSQLYFEDALNDEILAQGEYAARGPRDTTNRDDGILSGGDLQQFLFSTAKRSDGALHAWKVLSIGA